MVLVSGLLQQGPPWGLERSFIRQELLLFRPFSESLVLSCFTFCLLTLTVRKCLCGPAEGILKTCFSTFSGRLLLRRSLHFDLPPRWGCDPRCIAGGDPKHPE